MAMPPPLPPENKEKLVSLFCPCEAHPRPAKYWPIAPLRCSNDMRYRWSMTTYCIPCVIMRDAPPLPPPPFPGIFFLLSARPIQVEAILLRVHDKVRNDPGSVTADNVLKVKDASAGFPSYPAIVQWRRSLKLSCPFVVLWWYILLSIYGVTEVCLFFRCQSNSCSFICRRNHFLNYAFVAFFVRSFFSSVWCLLSVKLPFRCFFPCYPVITIP